MEHNPNSNIYVFSQPVRSRKTTRLRDWLPAQASVAGILTPDIGGRRMLYNITENKYHPFEADQSYGGEIIRIGNFNFSKTAFALAREILEQALLHRQDWLLIDEVGKLETEQGEGFEPLVLRIVKAYQSGKKTGCLLLVIRDSLLQQAVEKYALTGCRILSTELP